ncbi:hypothetical protein PROFUN_14964 [Planoprotostelium fungivorum]|uniref:Trichohyalin-plectin-homology domain-containing protein n=1 Tax=Planoprotostelium fungivorum TaxID=1890364 RepID=A0A2P6MYB4_9EUKA|nr:hypothetical protein PROFUN_14964 [Planoprotostelium fungivorum]
MGCRCEKEDNISNFRFVNHHHKPESTNGKCLNQMIHNKLSYLQKRQTSGLLREYTQRRQADDARGDQSALNSNFDQLRQKAEWEATSHMKMKQAQVRDKFHTLVAEESYALERRRKKLADLLTYEAEQYQKELDESQETSEMRQERMLARARELKAKREEERKKFAQEQLDRRWRDESDELRHLASQDLAERVRIERLGQLKQREEKLQREQEEQRYYDDLWEKDRQVKMNREKQETERRKKSAESTLSILSHQIQERRDLTESQMQELQDEGLRVRTKELDDRQRKYAAKVEMDRMSSQKKAEKEMESALQIEMDREFVRQMTLKERHAKEADQKAREQRTHDGIKYRQYLEEEQRKKNVDDTELNMTLQRSANEIWQKREEVRRKEEDFRNRLTTEVANERNRQMSAKRDHKIVEKQEALAERERIEADRQRWEREEREKQEKKRQERLAVQQAQLEQMEGRKQTKYQEQYSEQNRADQERDLKAQREQRIQQEIEKGAHYKNYNRKKLNMNERVL